jgi:hypothetical protein
MFHPNDAHVVADGWMVVACGGHFLTPRPTRAMGDDRGSSSSSRGRGGGRGGGRGRSSSRGGGGSGGGSGGGGGRGRGRGRGGGRSSLSAGRSPSRGGRGGGDGGRASGGRSGGRGRGRGRSDENGGRGRGSSFPGRGRGAGRGGRGAGFKRPRKEEEGTRDEESVQIPANKKRALRLQRQSTRPEFDSVQRAKVIWNKLRERKLPREERDTLVQELLGIVKGKTVKIGLKHDASRVIQCAIQFAPEPERIEMLVELKDKLVEMAQLTYAHFIVLKALHYCRSSGERKILADALRGHTLKLSQHSVGARVVESALTELPGQMAARMKSEMYGTTFSLFPDEAVPHRLSQAIEMRPDGERAALIKSAKEFVLKLHSKGLLTFQYAQDFLWEYFVTTGAEGAAELAPQLIEAYGILLSTRSGTRAAAAMIAAGGARERKRFMKSIKGYVTSSLVHRDAYLAILRLVMCTDDTVACQKTILSELLEPDVSPAAGTKGGGGSTAESWVPAGVARPHMDHEGEDDVPVDEDGDIEGEEEEEGSDDDEDEDEDEDEDSDGQEDEEEKVETGVEDLSAAPPQLLKVCLHKNGCKLPLCLLSDPMELYLDPDEKADALDPVLLPSDSGELVPTSKKDPLVRRDELSTYLRPHLISLCCSHPWQLMTSKFAGSRVLLEVMKHCVGGEDGERIMEAVVEAAVSRGPASVEDASAHLVLKQILKWEAEQQAATGSSSGGRPWLADKLYSRVQGKLSQWAASNRGAFVVAALREVPSVGPQADGELMDAAENLSRLAEEGSAGAKVLVEAIEAAKPKLAPKSSKKTKAAQKTPKKK